MINSTNMSYYGCGMAVVDCKRHFAFDWRARRLHKIGAVGLLLLIGSLATAVYSRSTNPGSTQSPSTQDSSDPLLASASSCPGQTQGDFTLGLAPAMRSTPFPANGNYSDTEQLSRPSNARNPVQQTALPAEPPTEFRNFINSTTGQSLPIYGASLFRASYR